jgi:predicted kinase
MVRAKVDCIHAAQSDIDERTRARERKDFVARIALAERHAGAARPFIAITCGLSGSGKTYLSQLAIERTGAVRLRSDIERKRLRGLAGNTRSASGLNAGLYSAQSSDLTFERLAELAREVVAAGLPVIVDATFIQESRRKAFAAVAASLGVPFVILHCRAQNHVVEARIAKRRAAASDASEADLHVLRLQRRSAEPFAPDEQAAIVTIDTEDEASIAAALDRLARLNGIV